MAAFSFDLEDINGSTGFIVEDASTALSFTPFSAGVDYNDDGIDDLLITSLEEGETSQNLQLIYGDAELPTRFDLDDLDGDNGVTITNSSPNVGINLNLSLTNLDFNGDGIQDVLTTNIEQVAAGQPEIVSRIVFGDEDLPATVNLGDLDGDNGTEFGGDFAIILAQSIDINGDDADDLILSGIDINNPNPDLPFDNFVLLGRDGNVPDSLSPSLRNGRNAFDFDLEGLPVAVGEREDVNDDGIDDLAINLFDFDLETEEISSSSSILFGSETFPGSIDPATFDGDGGFNLVFSDATGDELINSNLIADTNGDEIADIFVSVTEPAAGQGEGLDFDNVGNIGDAIEAVSQRAFVVYGAETLPEDLDLTDLDGSNGFEIVNSESESAVLRNSETLDLNNDGLVDFFITDDESGDSYIVFGRSEEVAEIDLADLAPRDGFALSGTESEIVGVNSGDINGDEIDDLILDTISEVDYVVFGSEASFGRELDLADEDANALEITAQDADLIITDVIDLNDDGAGDLVYGSSFLFDSLLEEIDPAFPDVQVVYGDADFGAS
ncbi:MAG: hypothetical protein AAFQ41_03840 [Cyanobacteria bacterium J06623_7]